MLFAPHNIVVFALAGFALFHLVNAYVMGLGFFVIPFISTYPSILYVSNLLRETSFGG